MRALMDEARRRIVLVPGAARLGSDRAGPVLWAPLEQPLRWTRSTSPVEPSHRIDEVAIVDSLGDRVLLFGGFAVQGGVPDNLVWSYSLAADTWEPLASSGVPPASRGASAAVLDPIHRRLLLFRGVVAAPDRGYAECHQLLSLELSGPPVLNSIPVSDMPR